jgi:glycine oxidase
MIVNCRHIIRGESGVMRDHLIIGGGIIGMLTARELCLAGASVTLLEKRRTGRESSWAGGGIVSPLYPWRYGEPVTALASWSQQHYRQLSAELAGHTGIDPEWTPSGLLIIAPAEQERALTWAAQTGAYLRIIAGNAVHTCEPALTPAPEQAIWMPAIAQVRNPRLAAALRREIDRLGVEVLEEAEVLKILTEHDRVTGLHTSAGALPGASVIVCAGAWSRELLTGFGRAPRIKPVLGQMILFRAEPGAISRITLKDDRYAIPRRDGRVLFGSTLEHVGFDKRTTEAARKELHAIATSRFPLLASCPVEHHWAGLRPGSPDGIPYIGPHPEIEGLFINAGHYRNGVVLGPASARLAADLLLGREPITEPAPFALAGRRE